MPKSVNRVILLGHTGKAPDISYTQGGKAIAKVSLATSTPFKDNSGEWQERTEWHNLIAWERTAEIFSEYVHKGSKIYVEGRLQTSSWEDKQSGEKKYRTEIVVSDLVLLDGKKEGSESRPEPRQGNGSKQKPQPQQEESFAGDSGITEEDIPF